MPQQLTVRELIARLQQEDPEARIFLEGCDCINPASKIWKGGTVNIHEDYQNQIMLDFGPRDSYTSRGWRETYPEPDLRPPQPPPPIRRVRKIEPRDRAVTAGKAGRARDINAAWNH